MATYSATGIVLKIVDYRDVDQLFHVYTKEHGKIIAMGRGTKKSKSKLRGHLEPFGVVQLLLAHGRVWDQLAGAFRTQGFSSITADWEKIAAATTLIELVDRLTHQGMGDARLFSLLHDHLGLLDQQPAHLYRQADGPAEFTKALFGLLGFAPDAQVLGTGGLRQFMVTHLEGELQSEKTFGMAFLA